MTGQHPRHVASAIAFAAASLSRNHESFPAFAQAMYGSQLLVPGATCSKSSKIYRRIGNEKLRAIGKIGEGGGEGVFINTWCNISE